MAESSRSDFGTPLGNAFVALHEMFTELVGAGFTEGQAIRIIGVMMAEQGRVKSEGD